jgi:ribosome-associated protein
MVRLGRRRQGSNTLNRQDAPSAHEDTGSAESSREDQSRSGALEDLILHRLDEDKAQDVVLIDLKDKSSVADSLIVASGRSHRHVGALADRLLRALKEEGLGRCRVEGMPHCDWVLIDAGDIIIHLFRPEVRAFYNIEKIWSVEPPARAAMAH